MMYSNRFVVCVLVNGQPQRELSNGVVKLPFETEYGLRFRNKNNRRAVVKFFIDGENVSGGGYIIDANDYIDIKRHHDKDRAFKFVSLDSPDAVDAGKNGPNPDKEKGLIEAHFYLEKERPPQPQIIYRDHHHHHHHDHHHYPKPAPWPWPKPDPWKSPYWLNTSDSIQPTYGATYNGGASQLSMGDTQYQCSTGQNTRSLLQRSPDYSESVTPDYSKSSAPLQDGCTVEGASTGQSFRSEWIDLEETATVLKLFLQGFDSHEHPEMVSTPRKKTQYVNNLEAENEELRRKLAELENEQLKVQLTTKKKRPRKKN